MPFRIQNTKTDAGIEKWEMGVFMFSFCKAQTQGSDQAMGPRFLELKHLTLCILAKMRQQQEHAHSQSVLFFVASTAILRHTEAKAS